jgi:U4/U6.U5 tri-snRNP component SNU23
VQTKRRNWDEEEYRKKAEERAEREKSAVKPAGEYLPAREREALTSRDEFYDFDSRVGKVTAVNAKDKSSGGFHCALCDVLLRDSISYTNHVNGRKHLRKAGISEYTKKSTLEDVLAVLEFGRRKKYPDRYVAQTLASSLATSSKLAKQALAPQRNPASREIEEPAAKRPKYEELHESPPKQALPDRKLPGRKLMAEEDED